MGGNILETLHVKLSLGILEIFQMGHFEWELTGDWRFSNKLYQIQKIYKLFVLS